MRRQLNSTPLVHLVTFRDSRNEPVRPRPELAEVLPHHADMLRYDLGFHYPDDTSVVIFPALKHKTNGNYPDLTPARWQSFGVRLTLQSDEESYACGYTSKHPVGDWITYQHPYSESGQIDYGTLAPLTLSVWLNKHPAVRVEGWRSVPVLARTRYWAVTG